MQQSMETCVWTVHAYMRAQQRESGRLRREEQTREEREREREQKERERAKREREKRTSNYE